MNTSATLAHLKNKLFEAQFQATIYHPNPEHVRMWEDKRARISAAVRKLQARIDAQLAGGQEG